MGDDGASMGTALGTIGGGIVGSIIPGAGTAAGAMIGGSLGGALGGMLGPKKGGGSGNYGGEAIGMMGYDERTALLKKQREEAEKRAMQGQTGSFRDAQLNALGQAQGVMMGAQPTAAEQMMRNQQQQNIAQSMAMAASARGGQNAGMNMRQAQMAGQLANQQALAQSMPMQVQERMAATQLAAGIGAQGRQYDTAYEAMQRDLANQALMAGYQQDRDLMNAELQRRGLNAQGAAAQTKRDADLKGGAMSTAGQIGAAMLKKS